MDKMQLATTYEFTFADGDKCELTLAFIRIKRLASKNRSLYDRYNKTMVNGPKEELEMLTVVYAAYVCANLDKDNILTEDQFIEKCGSDRRALQNALNSLINPKKQ